MKKIFCDGCGKIIKETLLVFTNEDHRFIIGDFCNKCNGKAKKLEIDYKEETIALKDKYKKMLKMEK